MVVATENQIDFLDLFGQSNIIWGTHVSQSNNNFTALNFLQIPGD
jgi:hypothetical protein